MAWSWAVQSAASVSPWRPAWQSHVCDWVRSTPGTSPCWAKNLTCISLPSKVRWWSLLTAV
eukprot:15330906-Ditylum_brightwellii.AAC.1